MQECAGLDGTLLAAAAFDPGAPLVLHAIDSDGVPLTLNLGNAISLFGCQVRFQLSLGSSVWNLLVTWDTKLSACP